MFSRFALIIPTYKACFGYGSVEDTPVTKDHEGLVKFDRLDRHAMFRLSYRGRPTGLGPRNRAEPAVKYELVPAQITQGSSPLGSFLTIHT